VWSTSWCTRELAVPRHPHLWHCACNTDRGTYTHAAAHHGMSQFGCCCCWCCCSCRTSVLRHNLTLTTDIWQNNRRPGRQRGGLWHTSVLHVMHMVCDVSGHCMAAVAHGGLCHCMHKVSVLVVRYRWVFTSWSILVTNILVAVQCNLTLEKSPGGKL
jgi:hypothetical protein